MLKRPIWSAVEQPCSTQPCSTQPAISGCKGPFLIMIHAQVAPSLEHYGTTVLYLALNNLERNLPGDNLIADNNNSNLLF